MVEGLDRSKHIQHTSYILDVECVEPVSGLNVRSEGGVLSVHRDGKTERNTSGCAWGRLRGNQDFFPGDTNPDMSARHSSGQQVGSWI